MFLYQSYEGWERYTESEGKGKHTRPFRTLKEVVVQRVFDPWVERIGAKRVRSGRVAEQSATYALPNFKEIRTAYRWKSRKYKKNGKISDYQK